jgi:hypothetical protein
MNRDLLDMIKHPNPTGYYQVEITVEEFADVDI